MGAVATTLPHGRPFSRSDLEGLPADGNRYELVDGSLVVTPSPSNAHQTVSVNLVALLHRACPRHLKLMHAPFDAVLSDDTVLRPDVLVGRRGDFTDRTLSAAPVLAVEILSPSTRRLDLMLKRSRYEAAACGSYWVVDPGEPSLLAWDLRDGRYAEVANVRGGEVFRAASPFAVDVTPADLTR